MPAIPDNSKEPLTGFKVKCGPERETAGIWMWSKPFTVHDADGRKVIIAALFHKT